MIKYSVYIHTNKVNGKRYIGVTEKKPEERWANGKGYKNNPYFTAAIQKYGWDNFDHFILEVDSRELMFQLEQQYIAYYKTTDERFGYNISSGGDKGHYLGKNSGSKEYKKYYVDRWNREHKEELRIKRKDYFKEYYSKNEERLKEYREKHREEKNLYAKRYRETHKEQIRECKKRCYDRKKMKDTQPITPLW